MLSRLSRDLVLRPSSLVLALAGSRDLVGTAMRGSWARLLGTQSRKERLEEASLMRSRIYATASSAHPCGALQSRARAQTV
eukprot:8371974-Pyramimonas_sp.AAC.1